MKMDPNTAGNKAVQFVSNLFSGKTADCCNEFNEKLSSLLDEAELKAGWDSDNQRMGKVVNIINVITSDSGADVIVKLENGTIAIKITFDDDDKISNLMMAPYVQLETPPGIEEEKIIIGKDTKWPLNGLITTSDKGRSDRAVVFVHGSGPSDMNETVFANAPFRDLAWSLCAQGIDSIRYDKRTFVHGPAMVTIPSLSVKEETIEDAILAGKMLRDRGYSKVILVGHSMGAMLSPRIKSESGDVFDSFVSMAGSPRTLTEIVVDQNLAAISMIPDENVKAANLAMVDTEAAKLPHLKEWSDEEAQKNTVFGVNAYYFKEMEEHNTASIAKSLKCPMLFLQGSADFQVDIDKDFGKWKELLSGMNGVQFRSYNGLNHLFMVSEGEGAGTIAEYNKPSHVEQCVIDDIAKFVKEQ